MLGRLTRASFAVAQRNVARMDTTIPIGSATGRSEGGRTCIQDPRRAASCCWRRLLPALHAVQHATAGGVAAAVSVEERNFEAVGRQPGRAEGLRRSRPRPWQGRSWSDGWGSSACRPMVASSGLSLAPHAATTTDLWEKLVQKIYRTATVRIRPGLEGRRKYEAIVEVTVSRSDRPNCGRSPHGRRPTACRPSPGGAFVDPQSGRTCRALPRPARRPSPTNRRPGQTRSSPGVDEANSQRAANALRGQANSSRKTSVWRHASEFFSEACPRLRCDGILFQTNYAGHVPQTTRKHGTRSSSFRLFFTSG